ncbi:GPI transamidase component GPI16 [Mycena sanguinolenta]|uniref:GPI transamidase component GPI16 n=1 Tax=Mycena sanguinolenta TaxID=230812 RepID=A0A8H6ZGD3_9AGAR|nr:GPI transamidase component GPI16 [Mycena sanguinolenta]
MRKLRFLWALCLLPACLSHSFSGETFTEELFIRGLPDGKVASRFEFSTHSHGATPRNPQNLSVEDHSQHYTLFPLALGQILREYAVTELHLTLNAGKWNYDRWGYPDEPDVAAGAALWAWMAEGSAGANPRHSVDARWRDLRNALAGLFCASIASLDEQRTTSPARAFTPFGALPAWPQSGPHAFRHASLPSENVCTENLTPFLKLLPCKSRSGLAHLLNPHRLFDADWHGMGLHVSWRPEDGVQVRLTFQSVFDPLRSGTSRDWSFSSLFDRTVDQACPVAASSLVLVTLPVREPYSIQPEPASNANNRGVFPITEQTVPLDISIHWLNPFQHATIAAQAPLSVRRMLRGAAQSHGTLAVSITNPGSAAVRVVYLETLPWIVHLYLHTLELSVDGIPRADLLEDISYIAPVPHERASTLEAILAIPANSTVSLRVGVGRAFLRYTEHPPDAQRGWELPGAVVVLLDSENKPQKPVGRWVSTNKEAAQRKQAQVLAQAQPRRIYTPALLVDPATPDFSMPYNVIIFTCSLVAFIFGSVFNGLTRRFVVLRASPE